MSFEVEALREKAKFGPVARIVVAETSGSVPRETGTSMTVTADAVSGTIGGGALEFEAIAVARDSLVHGKNRIDRIPLGPGLGQCCGGAVTLLTEVWDSDRLAAIDGDLIARPLPTGPSVPPLAVRQLMADARGRGDRPEPQIIGGWFVESVSHPGRAIWIFGAGHVGRAVAAALAPLPAFDVTLVDSAASRFPDPAIPGVTPIVAVNPADAVRLAPGDAEHLVLTYSHALDLEICHRVLSRDFLSLGLIGSKTKRARFRTRLASLGHTDAQISRMLCPIGDPALGKHPNAIAVGVAAELLRASQVMHARERQV